MNSRRNFIFKSLALSSATIATPSYSKENVDNHEDHELKNQTQELSHKDKLRGSLYVPVYGPHRLPLSKEYHSVLVKADIHSEDVVFIPSKVKNLHGLIESDYNNPEKMKIGIGHASKELLQIYDKNFNNIDLKSFPNINFRGHGINYKEGVLITAELQTELNKGILLYLDAYGNELGRFQTGSSRPHEIVDCGKFFAIAHYGDRPAIDEPKSVEVDGCLLLQTNNIIDPGVSFINKEDLTIHAFYPLPLTSKTTHLGVTQDGDVLAMGISEYFAENPNALLECALKNNINLLNIELNYSMYEAYVPIYKISAQNGLVETINYPLNTMRRGQSFSTDKSLNAIIATFSASQTLFIQVNENRKFINTLKYGVSDPRGCTLIPNTGWAAISGNSDNITIVDIFTEELIKIIPTPLGHHSHLYWFSNED